MKKTLHPRCASRPDWRVHLVLPGLLEESIGVRRKEFCYTSFSPFAIELVCFDLRIRREHHEVTHPFSSEPLDVQEAIDRQIVRMYEPRTPRKTELLKKILRGEPWFDCDRPAVRGQFSNYQDHVHFPIKLRPLIEVRWKELGYNGISAYVTGLIRYDLLLGGPHTYFNGADRDPEILAALDAETVTEFHARKRQRILLDYLIEDAAGRMMTDEERAADMRRLAAILRKNAIGSQRQAPGRRLSA